MTAATLGLILLSVTISAAAQICLKLGMSSPAVQLAISSGGVGAIFTVASNPAVLGGLALYGLGAISWLFALAKVDVSQAYPFVAIGIVLTLAAGYFLLAEPVTPLRVVGVLVVIIGIGLVAHS